MKCPFCSSSVNRVVDKRAVASLGEIRRRRQCLKCGKRFTTYERLAEMGLIVVKKDGRHEPFTSQKLRSGLVKALEKRPGFDRADDLVDKIERRLKKRGNKQIPSKLIGQMVLSELKKLDMVAYLRFASVYKHFDQPEDFAKAIENLN